MNVSSISSSSNVSTTQSQTSVEKLENQIKLLQKKLTNINSGDGAAETKQQQIELIESQIQQLEAQIKAIEKQKSETQTLEAPPEPTNNNTQTPPSDNLLDIYV
ncbi:MAG: DUF5320 domain-containing protein [Acetobacterium woodii]|nr:DUF5320 domain-containing protein [Acetobacterium woodii]